MLETSCKEEYDAFSSRFLRLQSFLLLKHIFFIIIIISEKIS